MIKRLVLAAAVTATLGAALSPASAGEVCLTSDVTVDGTALPTNGTTCQEVPEP